MTDATLPALVSAAWLAERINDPALRPVDVRWYLAERGRGRREYDAAHIPGAVYMDIDADLAAPAFSGAGRHPLPAPEAFAAAAGRAGIGATTQVVVYDAVGGAYATRLWWLLRYFGHAHVALLDGGWPAWQTGGYATESVLPNIAPATFTPRPRPELLASADDVERLRHDPRALILDARAAERYAGRVEPIDKRAGHIPGAKSAPYAQNLTADGALKQAEALKAQYDALGAEDAQQIVCYCGSGVTATHDIFALHMAGYPAARLYVGSWSDWSNDENRPIETS